MSGEVPELIIHFFSWQDYKKECLVGECATPKRIVSTHASNRVHEAQVATLQEPSSWHHIPISGISKSGSPDQGPTNHKKSFLSKKASIRLAELDLIL